MRKLLVSVIVGLDPAERHCAGCHVCGPPAGPGDGRAARLHGIAARPATTAEGLRAFLPRPHRRIPSNNFSAEQIDDVAAYILSLKP